MADLNTIVGSAIRTMLLANGDITTEVGENIGQVIVHGRVTLPYITFHRMYGGWLNTSPRDAFDTTWLVTAVAKTQPEARQIAGFISDAIRSKEPIFTLGYYAVAIADETDPFLDFTDLQNDQIWRAGAMYRFRGSK